MMTLELKVRTTEETLVIRRKRKNKPDGDFTNRKTTSILGAIASGEVTATLAEIFREVGNADD